MDFRNILGKLTLLEGSMETATKNPTGPKFTGQWQGTDAGTPGRKLVGDSAEPEESILKDLSKGPTPKTKEQELSEQFEAFLQQLEEENLGTHPKRVNRTSDRPGREYTKHGEQSKRYTYDKQETDESSGDPHKIVANKLKDTERSKHPVSDEAYAQHIERMKQINKEYLKKNPNSIYKQPVDEAGANNPPQVAAPQAMGSTAQPTQVDAKQAAATAQALTTMKSATGTTAQAPQLAKALGAASQGKPVGQQDMTALAPMMKDIATVAQDPKLASQFKTLAQQANQAQIKQQQQT